MNWTPENGEIHEIQDSSEVCTHLYSSLAARGLHWLTKVITGKDWITRDREELETLGAGLQYQQPPLLGIHRLSALPKEPKNCRLPAIWQQITVSRVSGWKWWDFFFFFFFPFFWSNVEKIHLLELLQSFKPKIAKKKIPIKMYISRLSYHSKTNPGWEFNSADAGSAQNMANFVSSSRNMLQSTYPTGHSTVALKLQSSVWKSTRQQFLALWYPNCQT